jgi:hypothetical protein
MVLRYHQETKHHFSHFARGPGRLDWANQPDPFRRYEGTSLSVLPLLRPGDTPASPAYEDLYRPGAIASASVSASSLSRLFEYSLAVSAWKQAGDVRWALRSNPSSGNLHPTEAYLLIGHVAGLSAGPGLYHYAAKEHALELRARWPEDSSRAAQGAFLLAWPRSGARPASGRAFAIASMSGTRDRQRADRSANAGVAHAAA